MALYFLTYDLRGGRDYEELYEVLEAYGAQRVLDSTWCFYRFNASVSQLIAFFRNFIDSDDALLISESRSWELLNAENTPQKLKQCL